MTKVMSAFDSAMIKAQCTAMNEASKMKQDKTSKFARIAITAMACMAMLLTCVFADGGSIEGRIASGLGLQSNNNYCSSNSGYSSSIFRL